MKRNNLFKSISLGIACLLGIGGAIYSVSSTKQITETHAAIPTTDDTLTPTGIDSGTNYPYTYGYWYLKFFSGTIGSNYIRINNYDCDFTYKSPSIIRSVTIYSSSAIDYSTDADVSGSIKSQISGLTSSPAAQYGKNVTFNNINQKADITITLTYDGGGNDAKLSDFYIKVVRDQTYTVTFNMNGVSATAPDSQSVASGGKVSQPSNPSATGYTFGGWYKEAGCTNAWNFSTDTVTADTTIYAKWTAIEYNISYNLNGGELPAGITNPTKYTKPSGYTLNNPVKEGYDFQGWTGSGLSTPTINVSVSAGSATGDKSYTANWTPTQYDITYINCDAGSNPTSYTIETETFSLTSPTKIGKTFLGWTGTDIDEQTTTVTIPQGSMGDREFTANWEYVPEIKTVVDLINAIGGTSNVEYPTSGSAIEAAESAYDALLLEHPEYDGYIDEHTELVNDRTTYDALKNAAIDETTNKISAIGDIDDVAYPGSHDVVIEAEETYNSLADSDKALVLNADLLDEACDKYYGQRNQAVTAVISAIDQIGTVSYPNSHDAISNAVALSVALHSDDVNNTVVTNLDTLTSAVNEYNSLKDAAINDTIAKIDDISNPLVFEDAGDEISAAREAYDALHQIDKDSAAVTNYQHLLDSEKAYEAMSKIEAIKDESTLSGYQAAVEAARAFYDLLNADELSLIPDEYKNALPAAENALDTITKINAIGDVEYTSTSKALIDEANDSYDALNDEEKAYVALVNHDKLVLANLDYDNVEESVNKVNAIGEVKYTAECKALIDDAKNYYEALSEYQKSIYPEDSLNTLLDAIAAYDAMDKINAIGELEYTPGCKTLIDEARSAYDALTAEQKAMVSNYSVLTKDEADYAADKAVVDEILGLGEITHDKASKDKVKTARDHYVALTSDQKAFFPEDVLQLLKDYEEVLDVLDVIYNIGEVEHTPECKALIDEARNAYDALSDDQKDLINDTDYAVLTKAESDYNAVEDVVKEINDIGDITIDETSKEKIEDARSHYNALSDEQKEIFPEDVLKILLDDEAAFNAMDKIDDIGEVKYTAECKALIDEARATYDALSDEQKEMVDNYASLTKAEADYAAVGKVVKQINDIGDITYDDTSKTKIEEARAAYVALTSDQKAFFPEETLKLLEDYEKAYVALEKIGLIGNIEYSEESETLIEEAREYYDSLTEEQKAKISTRDYSSLTDAEKTYSKMDKDAKTISIVLLIVSGLVLAGGIFFLLFLLLKKKKNNDDNDDKGGKKPVKTMSIGGLSLFVILASHYADAPFVALYIVAGLAVMVWIAAIVVLLLKKNKKKVEKPVEEHTSSTNKKEEIVANKPVTTKEVETINEANNEEEEVVTVTDEKGNIFQIRFVKSFTAKLIQSPEETKKYYEELKNEVLSYKKTTSRISWHYDSINSGRNPVLKFAIRGKTLAIYFPLNTDDYADSKYKVEKVESKKFEDVPCLYRIKNDRRLGYAKELIKVVMDNLGLEKGEEKHDSYILPYEENKPLIKRGLIKELKVQVNKPEEPVVLETKVNSDGDEILTTKDSKGNIFEIRYIKSFTAKLSQSSDELKNYYNIIKNYALSFKKANSRVSWHFDSINVGRNQVLKFAIRGKTLCVYYALNADNYVDSKYKVEKVESKKFEDVPCLYRIKNDRRCEYAKELIDVVMAKFDAEKGKDSNEDFSIPFESTKALLKKELIKELKTKVNSAPQEVRESISVKEADEKMSDEIAEANIIEDKASKKHEGKKGIINIDTIGESFNDGDVVDIEALWEKKLIPSNVGFVKVLARGTLNKKLHLDLQDYSLQAVKMILLEGGTVKKAK